MDASHVWGSDLQLSSSGDLLLATGSEAVRQRVLRRLLSVPGDLLFHPDYGAGMAKRVGDLFDRPALEAAVRQQMFAEAGVAQDPPPDVVVRPIPNGATVSIRYRDAVTGTSATIGFDVEG